MKCPNCSEEIEYVVCAFKEIVYYDCRLEENKIVDYDECDDRGGDNKPVSAACSECGENILKSLIV